jgi:hypothetical protein
MRGVGRGVDGWMRKRFRCAGDDECPPGVWLLFEVARDRSMIGSVERHLNLFTETVSLT